MNFRSSNWKVKGENDRQNSFTENMKIMSTKRYGINGSHEPKRSPITKFVENTHSRVTVLFWSRVMMRWVMVMFFFDWTRDFVSLMHPIIACLIICDLIASVTSLSCALDVYFGWKYTFYVEISNNINYYFLFYVHKVHFSLHIYSYYYQYDLPLRLYVALIS